MPPVFRFAPFWAIHAEMWAPLSFADRLNDRGGRSLRVFGRLKAGVITPKDFMGTYQNVPSVWLPIGAFSLLELGRDVVRNREDDCCGLIGRLKPGATMEK